MGLDERWVETGWDGLSFSAPPAWRIGELGPRYIRLDGDDGPAAALKWNPIRGRFHPARQIKRLNRTGRNGRFEAVEAPRSWRRALSDYDAYGFTFSGAVVQTRGVLLYCPRCAQATLLEFFGDASRPDHSLPPRFLESLADHRPDGLKLWALFDFKVLTPESFKLERRKLEPGRLELEFSAGRRRVLIGRWGPASVILQGRSLADFARAQDLAPATAEMAPRPEDNRLDWRVAGPSSWRERLKRAPRRQNGRLVHLPDKNRILGVRIDGDPDESQAVMDWIWERCETV